MESKEKATGASVARGYRLLVGKLPEVTGRTHRWVGVIRHWLLEIMPCRHERAPPLFCRVKNTTGFLVRQMGFDRIPSFTFVVSLTGKYVNMQLVVQASNSSVGHGNLGVVAQDVNTSTDVAFSNAQAWQCC
jgi:hypothetical protein